MSVMPCVSHRCPMHLFSKTKTKSRRVKGFSFLEVIISLFVLSVGFLGVTKLSVETLKQSFLQRDALIASMLAQEGVEGVYQIRDSNVSRGESDIFVGIVAGTYRVDIGEPSTLSNPGDYRLYFDDDNFYKHSPEGETPTKFSRRITIENIDAGSARRIVSMVVWSRNDFPSVNDCNKSNRCAFSWTELREND